MFLQNMKKDTNISDSEREKQIVEKLIKENILLKIDMNRARELGFIEE